MRNLNKKAESSKYLTPIWYITLAIVGVGIVIGVLMFRSISYDIKTEEAETLVNQVSSLIIEEGYLEAWVLENNSDFLKQVNLDSKLFNEGIFYINVKIFDNEKLIKNFIYGPEDFEIQCGLKGKDFAKCYKKQVFALDKNDSFKKYKILIFAGSNQKGSKI